MFWRTGEYEAIKKAMERTFPPTISFRIIIVPKEDIKSREEVKPKKDI